MIYGFSPKQRGKGPRRRQAQPHSKSALSLLARSPVARSLGEQSTDIRIFSVQPTTDRLTPVQLFAVSVKSPIKNPSVG